MHAGPLHTAMHAVGATQHNRVHVMPLSPEGVGGCKDACRYTPHPSLAVPLRGNGLSWCSWGLSHAEWWPIVVLLGSQPRRVDTPRPIVVLLGSQPRRVDTPTPPCHVPGPLPERERKGDIEGGLAHPPRSPDALLLTHCAPWLVRALGVALKDMTFATRDEYRAWLFSVDGRGRLSPQDVSYLPAVPVRTRA